MKKIITGALISFLAGFGVFTNLATTSFVIEDDIQRKSLLEASVVKDYKLVLEDDIMQ